MLMSKEFDLEIRAILPAIGNDGSSERDSFRCCYLHVVCKSRNYNWDIEYTLK